ncbi:RDD family protein [Streptomyces sp. URMC 123]|uniref:RDD family protein n=1 Tax=Streptomyces sp. URMC 123 TaxID=3423403 RepID=UPI003F1A922D
MSVHQPQGQRPGAGSPYPPYGDSAPLPGMAPLATTGQRFVARLIDTMVLGLLWVLMLAATGALTYATENDGRQDPLRVLLSATLTFALYFCYEGALLDRSGQTLGKRAVGIRVAVLRDGNIPRGRGWARAAVYVLPGMLAPLVVGWVFWLVNSLWFLWDKPYRLALHDKMAKTVVVSAR